MSKVDKLISHPRHGIIVVDQEGEILEEIVQRGTVIVKLVEGSTPEDAVFSLGESLCSLQDNFHRKLGITIAEGRCDKADADVTGCVLFSYAEGMATEEVDGEDEEGNEIKVPVSSITLPISGAPMPHGVYKRLDMLLSNAE